MRHFVLLSRSGSTWAGSHRWLWCAATFPSRKAALQFARSHEVEDFRIGCVVRIKRFKKYPDGGLFMSRQNKLRNKRTARQRTTREVYMKDGKPVFGPRKRGPRLPWGQPGVRQ